MRTQYFKPISIQYGCLTSVTGMEATRSALERELQSLDNTYSLYVMSYNWLASERTPFHSDDWRLVISDVFHSSAEGGGRETDHLERLSIPQDQASLLYCSLNSC